LLSCLAILSYEYPPGYIWKIRPAISASFQLKLVLAKTCTHRHTKLIRLMLSLPGSAWSEGTPNSLPFCSGEFELPE
jgi:hypothetical protein